LLERSSEERTEVETDSGERCSAIVELREDGGKRRRIVDEGDLGFEEGKELGEGLMSEGDEGVGRRGGGRGG
jgi:hypothetical protein